MAEDDKTVVDGMGNQDTGWQDWKPFYWHPWKKEIVTPEENKKWPPVVTVISTTYFPDYTEPEKRGAGDEWMSDNIRGDLARKSVKQLAIDLGYNVCIVDGGSSLDFVKNISSIYWGYMEKHPSRGLLPGKPITTDNEKIGKVNIDDQENKGYSYGRAQAIRQSLVDFPAREWDVLFQIELEKACLASEIEKMSGPILEDLADVVIPDRGIKAVSAGDERDEFRGYPPEQARFERMQNKRIHDDLVKVGLRNADDPILDLLGGTRALAHDPSLVGLFGEQNLVPEYSQWHDLVKPEKYLNAVYSPVYLALTMGFRVESVPIEYSHDPLQTEIESGNRDFVRKRSEQYVDIVQGSAFLIDYLGKRKDEIRAGKMGFDKKEYLNFLKTVHPDEVNFHWSETSNQITKPVYYSPFDYNLRPGGFYPYEDQFHNRRIWPNS